MFHSSFILLYVLYHYLISRIHILPSDVPINLVSVYKHILKLLNFHDHIKDFDILA